MLCDDLKEKLALGFVDLILVIDIDELAVKCDIKSIVLEAGYEFIYYTDTLEFRYYYENNLRNRDNKKVFVLADAEKYIPYDIQKRFYMVEIGYSTFFYNLDVAAIRESKIVEDRLLYIAYQNHFGGKLNYNQTIQFIKNEMHSRNNANEYVDVLSTEIRCLLTSNPGYREWYRIAFLWANIRHIVNRGYSDKDINILFKEVNGIFKNWMLENYKSLSANPISESPVMVYRSNDYISGKSKKAALIVIDGMSIENWQLLKQSLYPLTKMKENYAFSLLPSITSISRKAIFSGSLPVKQADLFGLSDEKSLWIQYWKAKGYFENDIFYGRGFNVELPYNTRIAGIIINDVDDAMHGQVFGSEGMNLNVSLFAKKGEINNLVDRLLKSNFDIYLTADHGNLEAIGIGKVTNEGLNTEATSQRARAYKAFADTGKIRSIDGVFQYPGYYLPKDFEYYLCDENLAFANKGKTIVCHGGMSVEEVIVPFIEIRSK
ncbi:MAG: BREX-3 system phosphatase PglZ [Desulfitobacterium hafniense]|nr:BREX-3 system phosphatase PglZ [Desulfitobacterium hafniense]